MTPEMLDAAKWLAAILIGVLGWFLRDAHAGFKSSLMDKVDRTTFESAVTQWHTDMRTLEERHQRENERLERQYEVKFAGVVQQFQERINNVEKNLSDRMDLILKILDGRKP